MDIDEWFFLHHLPHNGTYTGSTLQLNSYCHLGTHILPFLFPPSAGSGNWLETEARKCPYPQLTGKCSLRVPGLEAELLAQDTWVLLITPALYRLLWEQHLAHSQQVENLPVLEPVALGHPLYPSQVVT